MGIRLTVLRSVNKIVLSSLVYRRSMWRIIRRDAATVLNDEKARRSLARYFAVMQDEKPAKYVIAKKIPADFDENDSV